MKWPSLIAKSMILEVKKFDRIGSRCMGESYYERQGRFVRLKTKLQIKDIFDSLDHQRQVYA